MRWQILSSIISSLRRVWDTAHLEVIDLRSVNHLVMIHDFFWRGRGAISIWLWWSFFGVTLFLGWFEFESFERADACSVMLTPISSIILVNSLTFDSKSMVGGEAANRVGSGFFKPQRRWVESNNKQEWRRLGLSLPMKNKHFAWSQD